MNSSLQLKITGGIVFLFSLVIGVSVSVNSWDQLIYFYSNSTDRDPAAIKAVYDFSHLEGSALQMASRDPLITNAKITLKDDSVGVSLGHFVTRNQSGRPEFACRIYDRVEVTFLAKGMAVNGEPSKMKIEGPCNMGKDVNRISTIWVPMKDIMNQEAGNVELQFMDGKDLFVRFDNVTDQWPRSWHLEQVRLLNSDLPGYQVHVDRQDIPNLRNDPISFYWQ